MLVVRRLFDEVRVVDLAFVDQCLFERLIYVLSKVLLDAEKGSFQ